MVENDVFLVSGSKLTRFLCLDIEIALVIEIDLISVMGYERTWFLGAGSKSTWS